MQLSDIVALVAKRGMERHVEKRGGVMLPLAVGAMLPGIAHNAIERSRSSERELNHAETAKVGGFMDMFRSGVNAVGGQMLGDFAQHAQGKGTPASGLSGSFGQIGAAPATGVASGVSGGISEMIKRKMLGQEFGEQKDPFHMAATGAVQTFGKGIGEMGVDLLRDMASKAMATVSGHGDESARQAILGDLKRTDTVLAGADDKVLMEAYHTMSRFAPVLSTDKNAVRSFLRQAVMSGSGPDYMSIKLLADSERAVTGDKGTHR